MSSNTLSAHQGADTTDAQTQTDTVADRIPAGADRLGIDAEGRIHYWNRAGDEMVIVEPTADLEARIERVDVSPGEDFVDYIENAKKVAGFESHTYDEGWLEGAI
jgi:PAS domain-containing protein